MKISCEIEVSSFQFWAGAADNAKRFSLEELDEIETMLEDIYGEEGMSETMLNDIMWFEPESFCEMLGIDFDEWIERDPEYRYK